MKTIKLLSTDIKYRRQNIPTWSLLLSCCLIMASCGKNQLFDFAKRPGNTVTINRPVTNNFTKIFLNDDVDLVITTQGEYDIKLVGGENLLPGIVTDIKDSTLTISNTNTFNWMRSYDNKITAYVTLPHLLELEYKATSTVTNKDTIREDSLVVTATGGSGYIDLVINTGTSKLAITDGSADMKISGKTGVNFIYSDAYGPFRCIDLQSQYLFMHNASPNDCYVNVQHHFEYLISSLGNIYYKGYPLEISGSSTSSGKLISLNK